MKANMGKKDRMIRIIVGLVILAVHYLYYAFSKDHYYCVWANLGWYPLITGLFQYSPLYAIFKKKE